MLTTAHKTFQVVKITLFGKFFYAGLHRIPILLQGKIMTTTGNKF